MPPLMPLFSLWAKSEPFRPLVCHMVDVGNVALTLLRSGPFSQTAKRFASATGIPEADAHGWLAYLAALHDLGKCHAAFQGGKAGIEKGLAQRVESATSVSCATSDVDDGYRHAAFSRAWVQDFLIDQLGWPRTSAWTAANAIGGHHGYFGDDDPTPEPPDHAEAWEPLRRQLESEVRAIFRPAPWKGEFAQHSVAGVLLTGLLVLSDWVASNTELFSVQWSDQAIQEYAEMSRNQARLAIHRLGLDGDHPWQSPMTFREVWPNITEPRALQRQCEEMVMRGLEPGLVVIEALMGGGKTEAALYIATQWLKDAASAGVYMALPTAATSNQMFGRFKQFLGRHDPDGVRGVRLVHGTSWLLDEAVPNDAPDVSDDPELALDWFQPRKRSLLAPYGVGTVDQALMGALHVKHGFLRLFGLAGKVLIVDEVHAYDAYMSRILALLLKWCGALSIPVILLSATLPQRRREELVRAYKPSARLAATQAGELAPYPLITWVEAQGEVYEESVPTNVGKEASLAMKRQGIVVLRQHWGLLQRPAEVARLVAERVASGGCHCVIANTVGSAQQIYRELKKLLPREGSKAVRLLLFHARFPADERQRMEQEVLALFDKRSTLPLGDPNRTERPERAILVATQVVEQSLDLDFDEMYTEPAPVDLLLQRSGRLHRHEGRERSAGDTAMMHLLLPPEGNADFGPTARVYGLYILLRTLALLDTQDEWRLPDDIRQYVEAVYDEDAPLATLSWAAALQELARDKWTADARKQGEEAKRYLVRDPSPKRFSMGHDPKAVFDEDDADAASYFAAKTRYGDDSISVLLREGDEWTDLLASSRRPPLDKLQYLNLRMVRLPRWWLCGIEAASGYDPAAKAPRWMPGTTVLHLKGGCWEGVTQKGESIRICADHEYGVLRERKGVE